MSTPLSVIFLWHMHQPYYKDPLRGEYVLPWTYLHAVKDYYDMAAIVDETPGAKVVFNLVPSLLDQLEDYAAGTAVDPFLIRGEMDPADMTEEDRLFILHNFFSANRQRMIEPYKRYLELFCLAGDGDGARQAEQLRYFHDQEFLDLQVWFFLAWTGEAARRRFPVLQVLLAKGRQFTREDKAQLFACHRQILRSIIPLYQKLHDEGKAELSVSPYYHPILPLLCDMRSAQTAMPKALLPVQPFQHPEDARSQVLTGMATFRRIFGFTPEGMWPSEGSVSDAALAVIADCGLRWAATDEEVLANTLGSGLGPAREALYHPYRFGHGRAEVSLFFRDHALSDLIGFTYSKWDAERAVSDFMGRLCDIRAHTPGAQVVPIILDGENAWEYYPDNGYHFLSRLYATIAGCDNLRLVTCTEALATGRESRHLAHVHPGSWINANYGIWVGHPEENLGWDLLAKARMAAVRHNSRVAELLSPGTVIDFEGEQDQTAAAICQALFAAEGSDWFWWYGDDHFSPHSHHFDALFRRHLTAVYHLLGVDVPAELYDPIKKKSPAGFVRDPAALISPAITGLISDYFEWLAAGLYDLAKQSSAMHAAESLLQSFFYGFDRQALYFRLDGEQALENVLRPEDLLILHLVYDREYRVVMGLETSGGSLQVRVDGNWQDRPVVCQWRIRRVCEVRVPLDAVSPEPGSHLFAFVTLLRSGDEVGRWPTDSPMRLKYAGPELELETWLI
jgi:alpha-amylase/alpha-mannosidase (GH57 family)